MGFDKATRAVRDAESESELGRYVRERDLFF